MRRGPNMAVSQRTRRELLALCGGATGLLAGCFGDPADPGDEESPDREGNDSQSGALFESGQFAAGCPSYPSTERVLCYDAIGEKSVPGLLEPGARTLAPGSSVDFTLRNDSDAPLRSNFYDWQVHKRVDGEWFHVAPLSWPEPLMTVEPGGTHTWTVTLDDVAVESGNLVPRLTAERDVALPAVGGGTYAFRARGFFADDDFETALAFAATFDIDAPPLELAPTTLIDEPEFDGETLRASSSRGNPETENPRFVLELERLEPPVINARRMVTEQIVRRLPLRDAVALAEEFDADSVAIVEENGALPMFTSNLPRSIEYQGSYYEVVIRQSE